MTQTPAEAELAGTIVAFPARPAAEPVADAEPAGDADVVDGEVVADVAVGQADVDVDEPAPDPAHLVAVVTPTTITDWVIWHAVELAIVATPAVLALIISAWWLLAAVPAAGMWTAHEIRARRPAPAPSEETTHDDRH